MIDELREEAIVNKVGGRFKLSTLIQKRLVAINAGSRPLVDMKSDNKLEIVIQEIIQDKIYLDTSNNLKITGETPMAGGPPELDLANLTERLGPGHAVGPRRLSGLNASFPRSRAHASGPQTRGPP